MRLLMTALCMVMLFATTAAAEKKAKHPQLDRTYSRYESTQVVCFPIMAALVGLGAQGFSSVAKLTILENANNPSDLRPPLTKKSGDNLTLFHRKKDNAYTMVYNAVKLKSGQAFMTCLVAGGIYPEWTLEF